jgi:hypothetical protein
MPEIMKAITITTTVQAAALADQWGVPLVVGESSATAKNTLKSFVNLAALGTEHGTTSNVYKAAASIFNQGVAEVYTIAIQTATPGSPTPAEINTSMNGIIDAAVQAGNIQGMVLAGLTDTNSVTQLQTNADRVGVIWVSCNAIGETVSTITTRAAALSSVNGFMVAYKGSAGVDDVAAATLGAIMVLQPWVALMWKNVDCDVNAYFVSSDITSLEAGRVNVIMPNGTANILSNGMATSPTANFIDITRCQYLVRSEIAASIAAGKMASETVPYTAIGIATVRGWIITPLENLITAGALASYSVTLPALAAIPETDRAARVLQGVTVTCQLAGNIQTFALDLDISV